MSPCLFNLILLLTVTGAAVTTAQINVAAAGYPLWLRKEMQNLFSEAEVNMNGLENVITKIKDLMTQAEYRITNDQYMRTDDLREYPVGQLQPSSTDYTSVYPRNCVEAMQRDDRGGWRMIDPDGDEFGLEAFYVRCETGKGKTTTTEFGLYSEWMERYQGDQSCRGSRNLGIAGDDVYCPDTKTEIPYKLSRQQIASALRNSGNCSQTITWSCHGNSILYLSSGGGKLSVYGRVLQQQKYFSQGRCDCRDDMSCRQSHLECNCGSSLHDVWLRDVITITDKSRLPITEIILGDMSGSRDRAQLSVSPIICSSSAGERGV